MIGDNSHGLRFRVQMRDRRRALVEEMRASFERLQTMVADLHPTDEADPAKAEMIADLKRELESLRGRIEELESALGD